MTAHLDLPLLDGAPDEDRDRDGETLRETLWTQRRWDEWTVD